MTQCAMQRWRLTVVVLFFAGIILQVLLGFGPRLLHQVAREEEEPASVCNPFEGHWTYDHGGRYPLYGLSSCPFVEDSFSCAANGRPDAAFASWTWQPHSCSLPQFNGTIFLERMRGKHFVFVGDSLSRNQWESLLCMLTEALPDKSRVVEVNGLQVTKDTGAFHFKFQDYHFHLEYYGSHFLVDEREYNNSLTLRLDQVHRSHPHWKNADVLVFTTGHWWTHGKTAKGKNFYQEGSILHPKLNLMVAFSKALQTWATWVDTNVNLEKTRVFFVGYSPGHFRGGKWNSGGECQSAIQPIMDGPELPRYPEKMQVIEQVVHSMKFPVMLLNITRLSGYRHDGHPSVYGLKNKHGYQDCSHWCLPGVPDVWNVLLYALLVKAFGD